jgi:uncharacterized protein (DUF2147 family)
MKFLRYSLRTTLLSAFVILILSGYTYSEDRIIGKWLTNDKEVIIEIYEKNGKFYGRLDWMEEAHEADGSRKVDDKNPDQDKHGRLLQGLVVMTGFTYEGNDRWSNGTIYNPNTGRTYSAYMTLDGDKLYVRGYVGFTFIGKTEVASRVE